MCTAMTPEYGWPGNGENPRKGSPDSKAPRKRPHSGAQVQRPIFSMASQKHRQDKKLGNFMAPSAPPAPLGHQNPCLRALGGQAQFSLAALALPGQAVPMLQ